ncbi:MAG: glycine betaine ABC transporter substrate-binding protein [Myxococcota bacterium]|nr:glycine betaine ABC transporter substrate-binding protein [Myxococcota bacterium]
MSEQLALLPGYLTAHLQLSLPALVIAALISIPLGILVTRRRGLEPGVVGTASVIQTIPSLALLAIMVPVLAALGTVTEAAFGIPLRGIGFAPAFVALTLYGLLPILRNTVTGVEGVDPALVEAARGVGMTPREQLRRVELPLAMPVIVAGLRTAGVWVIGTATLSTPVGATSLGNFIFSGLQTRNFDAVLVGCVAAALLALTLDQLIRALESGIRERRRGRVRLAGGALAALLLFTGASFFDDGGAGDRRPVTIGSKAFTEQYVLSEILAQQIAARTGLPTEAVQSLGSTVAFEALRNGDLDLYVDYSGTIWATLMERSDLPETRGAVLEAVKGFLGDAHGITVVGALGFENTYALGMRADRARERGIARISDLSRHAPALEIGGDYEFFQRTEWRALADRYGLPFRHQRTMDPALMYQAVAEGEVDVISAYSTDGRIAAYDLVLLEDDQGVIPPYDAIVLARPGLARERPEVLAALRPLVGAIDAGAMQRMNLAVDGAGEAPGAVAQRFLAALKTNPSPAGEPPTPGR